MEKLSNTEAELKKSVAYKKKRVVLLAHTSYTTRNAAIIHFIKNKTLYFQKFIFSCERNSLEHKTLESIFKNSVLKFIIIAPNSVFDCENHRGVKLRPRMCVGLSHFRKQKFKQH